MPDSPRPRRSSTSMEQRKAKKREMDRISQQRKRQKDRETLQKLEVRLQTLQERADDKLVYNMVLKHEQDQARIDRHLDRAKKIHALLQADIEDLTAGCETNGAKNQNSLNTSYPSEDSADMGCSATSDSGGELPAETLPMELMWPNTPPLSFLYHGAVTPQPSHCDILAFSDPHCVNGFHSPEVALPAFALEPETPPSFNLSATTSPASAECRKCETDWTTCNRLVTHARDAFKIEGTKREKREDLEAHFLILAVTQGWNKVPKQIQRDPLWQCVRQLDELTCQRHSGQIERLAELRMVHRLLKSVCIGEQTQVHPAFLRPRPFQLQLPHAAIADYFVWPGFRERIIFGHGVYCNNAFSRMFHTYFRFVWPFEVRDTYIQNRETRLFDFSSTFKERSEDIRNWRLDGDFLNVYPEFTGDVPLFNSRPAQIDISREVSQWHSFSFGPDSGEEEEGPLADDNKIGILL